MQSSQSFSQGSLENFIQTNSDNYFPINNPQQSLYNDRIFYSMNQFVHTGCNLNGFSIHVPQEQKNPSVFIRFSRSMSLKPVDLSLTHFPRFKHFNKNLPKLPYEPYQRMMTYAIEICMIPSIWYLELIHCTYMGMAPFFSGMLMSYTLQDVVGSAIKTMGYLDESFSIENCYRSVSSFTDTHISSNYEEICDSMSKCLLSNQFSSEPYLRLKEEFQKRIDNVYSEIESQEKKEQYKNYARHSLLLSLSSKTINLDLEYTAVERNFLVVRAMILSMSYLVNKFIPVDESTISERMSKVTRLISHMIFAQFKSYMKTCMDFFPGILGSNSKKFQNAIELFCKEFVSIGVIDESVELIGGDINAFNKAILPSRVLDPAYASVIPSLIDGSDASGNLSWLKFQSVEKIEHIGSEVDKKKPMKTKYLKAANDRSIHRIKGSRTVNTKKSGITNKVSKLFTRRKQRISGLISSHLNPADS
ncbi:uncharacterized protein cubi_03585 [Cryptosporidium ubiquitum]|uniref:Uncharacterized protein n=1 Tax=Cryptosporidium ubiquitum TaxID=857276 RepID=A0A1J4MK07_9CRYT|nr:uncharacterized protein cubi_03585 [Cryptosporidium ubiquitum]OII73787.1 hypothetical protein cubi_03585 [Cryptosporidium ubiquitum]